MSRIEFIKRTFIVLGVALIPVLVWYLFDVILIAVAALLVGELLWLGAEPLTRWLRLPPHLALFLSGIGILAIVGGGFYVFGTGMTGQLQDVIQRAQSGQSSIVNLVRESALGNMLMSHLRSGINLMDVLPRVFTVSVGVLGGIVAAIVAGVFFAAQPQLYLAGLIQLFPPRLHGQANETVEHVATALRLWLLGQLCQMVLIGVLTTLVVWLIGLPSPFALGLIAGLAEFIPYLGPVIAAIPAVLVAANQSPHTILWVIVAYTLIHQAEGHVIMPFIQRFMVFIPPAVILLAIVAIGALFGALAIPLASPIAVMAFVLVKKLYIRDTLGEDSAIPGETEN
ncbi:MAG TPA: AI-2E family transporter [Xanthobacteraceae bacterium]|nr:AI-2E family transporter [Xanthobacteraceae bacterium]